MILRSLVPRASWLPILLLYYASVTLAEEAIITLLQNPAWSYRAELADFGYILDQRLRYNANFMTPPMNESQLCNFPSFSLANLDKASRLSKPVALLVSLGGCDTGQKVEVALEIHKKVTNFLRFIVFYNNDPNNPDEIFKVNPPPNNTIYIDDLEEMSFSAVSTATSSAILAHMEQFTLVTGAMSNFLGPASDGWMLEMIIETAANPYVGSRSGSNQGGIGNTDFYWFRITLFALLVLSPFCRAMFLWWTGGGRVRLRRNENGRVVGLLYTPPMAYWFVSHGTQEPEPVADTMTTEEVMALPEIVYKPPPSETHLGTTTEVESDDSDDNNDGGGLDKPVAENSDDGRLIMVVDRASATLNASQRTELMTTTTNDDDDDNGEPMTTCSTACSICIDDFETGEKIRLLRCGHAFHTDCILPWLTRRQGCCPMCKKSVMGEQQQQQDEDQETNDAEVESSVPPFSRCLEINNSGVETIEDGSAATPSVDRTVAAGDAEMTISITDGGNNNNNNINEAEEESTTLPDAAIDLMLDPEQQQQQAADQIANAVVNGFADSLKSDLSHDTDITEVEEEENNNKIPPVDVFGVAILNLGNEEESDLLKMEEDSEAEVDNVESWNNKNEDIMDEPHDVESPKEVDMSSSTENDVVTVDVGENDLSGDIEKDSTTTSLDEKMEPAEQLVSSSAVVESDSTKGEINAAATELPDEIQSTIPPPGDLEQVHNDVETDPPESLDVPDQDGSEEEVLHGPLHDNSETSIVSNSDENATDEEETPTTLDLNTTEQSPAAEMKEKDSVSQNTTNQVLDETVSDSMPMEEDRTEENDSDEEVLEHWKTGDEPRDLV